jgi:hypothetical protein
MTDDPRPHTHSTHTDLLEREKISSCVCAVLGCTPVHTDIATHTHTLERERAEGTRKREEVDFNQVCLLLLLV